MRPSFFSDRSSRTGPASAARRCVLASLVAVLALCVPAGPSGFVAGASASVPQPDAVPTRWQLDFQVGPMRLITLESDSGEPRAWWYMTLEVENNSGRDQFFVPAFDLTTDEGQVVRAGRGVPGKVYRELLDLLDDPLLDTQFAVQDVLLQGEENARRVLIVWPAADLDADELSVFFIGFSGENEAYRVRDPETGELREFVLRKTYRVDYCVPGEMWNRGSRPFERCGSQWVLR